MTLINELPNGRLNCLDTCRFVSDRLAIVFQNRKGVESQIRRGGGDARIDDIETELIECAGNRSEQFFLVFGVNEDLREARITAPGFIV